MTRLHAYITAALLAAAFAPAGAQESRERPRERVRERVRDRDDDGRARIDTTFAFGARGSAEIVVPGGDVIVRAWDQPRVRVRGETERGAPRVSVGGSYFNVHVEGLRGSHAGGELEVMVPVGTRVRAQSQGGDLTIVGTKAEVEAYAMAGDVLVEDAADRVMANTLSGDLTIRRVQGDLRVTAVSGDVGITDVTGDVEATSVSGDLTLRSVTSRRVRAKTTSGDVSYEGAVDAAGRYDLGSHAGDVDVVVPAGLSAQVTVSTFSGTIESDFPITLPPGQHALGVTGTKRFTFDVGRGEARLTAESFSGDVTIRQRGRARAADR